jgi:hypothetical protein
MIAGGVTDMRVGELPDLDAVWQTMTPLRSWRSRLR